MDWRQHSQSTSALIRSPLDSGRPWDMLDRKAWVITGHSYPFLTGHISNSIQPTCTISGGLNENLSVVDFCILQRALRRCRPCRALRMRKPTRRGRSPLSILLLQAVPQESLLVSWPTSSPKPPGSSLSSTNALEREVLSALGKSPVVRRTDIL